jgi:hypothetical protein
MRRSYMVPAAQMNREITLRTIAAAWKCTYDPAEPDAPYAGILSREDKPLAVVYIDYTEPDRDDPEPDEPSLDALSLQRGNSFALETGIAAVYVRLAANAIAVLIRKGEPLTYSYRSEYGQLVAVTAPQDWKTLPLPPGTHWSTAPAGAAR